MYPYVGSEWRVRLSNVRVKVESVARAPDNPTDVIVTYSSADFEGHMYRPIAVFLQNMVHAPYGTPEVSE